MTGALLDDPKEEEHIFMLVWCVQGGLQASLVECCIFSSSMLHIATRDYELGQLARYLITISVFSSLQISDDLNEEVLLSRFPAS